MTNRIWRKIPNYSRYEASNYGEIKTPSWKGHGVEKIMRPALDRSGYLRTMLKRDDGVIHTIKVHRIIAQTFIENVDNKPQVNHKNSIRSDNRVENLEWVTHKENIKHSFTMSHNHRGENNSCATLTDAQVIEIRANYQFGRKGGKHNGITKQQIADKYNTTFSVIKSIVQKNQKTGKWNTWAHLK